MIGFGVGLSIGVIRIIDAVITPVIGGAFADVQNGAAYTSSLPIAGGLSPFSPVITAGSLPPGLTVGVIGSNLVLSGVEV